MARKAIAFAGIEQARPQILCDAANPFRIHAQTRKVGGGGHHRRGITLGVGDAADNPGRPDRRSIICPRDGSIIAVHPRQGGVSASPSQGKIAPPFFRGCGDCAAFFRMKRERLALVVQFRTEQTRRKDGGKQIAQSGTVSANIWNRMAVKLS